MNQRDFNGKYYSVQAKREGRNQPWTEWISVYDFDKAIEKAKYVEKAGYIARIVEKGVKSKCIV
jgi:hypothetical protein